MEVDNNDSLFTLEEQIRMEFAELSSALKYKVDIFHIINRIEQYFDLVESDDPGTFQYFVMEVVRPTVTIAMRRRDFDPNEKRISSFFLQRVLHYLGNRIHEINTAMLGIIADIFYLNDPFYNKEYPTLTNDMLIDQGVIITNSRWEVSSYYLANVNIFYKCPIRDLVYKKLIYNFESHWLSTFAKIFHLTFDTLSEEGLQAETFFYFIELFFDTLENLDEKTLSKCDPVIHKAIHEKISQLLSPDKKWSYDIETLTKKRNSFENFRLKNAINWLRLPQITKRMFGIDEIRKIFKTGTMTSHVAIALVEFDILDILFGATMHPELLQMSEDILRYVAPHMTPSQVFKIWQSSLEHNQTVRYIIWEVLSKIVPQMTSESSLAILDCLEKYPRADIDTNYINFIENSVSFEKTYREKGFMILWNLAKDDQSISNLLSACALDTILTTIKFDDYFMAQICKENITEGFSIPQSIHILEKMIDKLPPFSSQISYLEQISLGNVLDLILQQLDQYVSFLRENYSEKEENFFKSVEENRVFNYYSFMDCILKFIQFIKNAFELTKEHFDILWRNYIDFSFLPEIRETFFHWLQMTGYDPTISIEMIILLTDKFNEMNICEMSKHGFLCMEYFLRVINFHQKNFEQYENEIRIRNFEYYGIELLWKCTEFANDEVSKLSMCTIISLQHSIHPNLIPKVHMQRENFIRRIFERNNELLSQTDHYENIIAIQRNLLFLKHYLETFRMRRDISSHSKLNNGRIVKFRVTLNDYSLEKKEAQLEMVDTSTIRDIRDEVSVLFHYPIDQIAMTVKFPDNLTLRALGIPERYPLLSLRWVSSSRLDKKIMKIEDDTSILPHVIIQENHFEDLINYLNFDDTIARESWEVIMKIPTNSFLKHKLEYFPNLDSDNIEFSNMYELQYQLQIIEILDSSNPNMFQPSCIAKSLLKIFMNNGFNSYDKDTECVYYLVHLINHFSHKSSDNILNEFDTEKIIEKIMSCTKIASDGSSNEYMDISNHQLIGLLSTIILYNTDLFSTLISRSDFVPWFLCLLIESNLQDTPQFLQEKLKSLLPLVEKNSIQKLFFILDDQFNRIVSVNDLEETKKTISYFEMYKDSLEEILKDVSFEGSNIFQKIFLVFKQRQFNEEYHGSEDWILIGLLRIIQIFLQYQPLYSNEIPVEKILDALFDIPTSIDQISTDYLRHPLCKSKESRREAFNLLLEISKCSDENTAVISEHLIFDLLPYTHFEIFNYRPERFDKGKNNFLGLNNLGATCYMNSLFQQLFMNLEFKDSIMSVKQDEKTLLSEFQKILAHLEFSIKRDYNPFTFTQEYKDRNGHPMNVAVQIDAEEFLSVFFDKLENLLKGHPQENILKDIFGGTQVYQVISKECDHVSERTEDFLCLSLSVKGKKNVQESLEEYISGSVLDGDNKYHCENCDKKVTAVRRCCINDLPRNLIVHLQRFDFDLELMSRRKLNEYFEFNDELDLEPYTKSGLSRREGIVDGMQMEDTSSYELKGILVHMGSAESGHYYSLIKDDKSADWFKFNDSDVSIFNTENIREKCYGGREVDFDYQNQQYYQKKTEKNYSAYMLFYQLKNERGKQTFEMTPKKSLKDQVVTENISFLRDKQFFDGNFIDFMENFLGISKSGLDEEMYSKQNGTDFDPSEHTLEMLEKDRDVITLKLCLLFYLNIVQYYNTNTSHKNIYSFMELLLANSWNCCHWFILYLTEEEYTLRKIDTGTLSTQKYFSKLIINAITVIASPEYDYEEMEQNEKSAQMFYIPVVSNSVVISFINKMLYAQDTMKSGCMENKNFFKIIDEFLNIGQAEIEFALKTNLLMHLLHIYLAQDSPVEYYKETYERSAHFNPKYLLLCICTLIKYSEMEDETFTSQLLTVLVDDTPNNPDITSEIISCISEGNWKYQKEIFKLLTKYLNKMKASRYNGYFKIVEKLLQFKDQNKEKRLEAFVNMIQTTSLQNFTYEEESRSIIKNVTSLLIVDGVRRALIDYIPCILIVLQSNNKAVRQDSLQLIKNLYPPLDRKSFIGKRATSEEKEDIETLFNYLSFHILDPAALLQERLSELKTTGLYESFIRVVYWILKFDSEKIQVFAQDEPGIEFFMQLLLDLNETNKIERDLDLNVYRILQLVYHLISESPECLGIFIDRVDFARFIEIRIIPHTVQQLNSKSEEHLADEMGKYFLGTIRKALISSDDFVYDLSNNDTFIETHFHQFYLSSQNFPQSADIIFDIFQELYLEDHRELHTKICSFIKRHFTDCILDNTENIIRLLELILDQPQDQIEFALHGGVQMLFQTLGYSSSPSEKILKMILLSTHWFTELDDDTITLRDSIANDCANMMSQVMTISDDDYPQIKSKKEELFDRFSVRQ